MKSKCSFILKAGLSLVLVLLLLFSTMATGLAAVVEELAGTGSYTSDGTAILFFNMTPSYVDWWNSGTNGDQNFAYFFNDTTNKNAWSAHSVQESGNIYYVVVPAGTWEKVILTRNSVTSNPSWDNDYNQSKDIVMSASSNYISNFSPSDWANDQISWSSHQVTSTASLTSDPNTIASGQTATLTPALASNTGFNDFDVANTSYEVTTNPGSAGSVTAGGVFSATAGGTYVVTATLTYSAKGYSSITNTATVTQTINVGYTVTFDANSHGDFAGEDTATVTVIPPATTATEPVLTADPGYEFTSWYTTSSGTGGSSWVSNSTTVNADVTVYAQWSLIDYTLAIAAGTGGQVRFSDGSFGASANATVTVESSKTVVAQANDGYIFHHWATTGGSATVTSGGYSANATVTNVVADESTVTLTAVFVPMFAMEGMSIYLYDTASTHLTTNSVYVSFSDDDAGTHATTPVQLDVKSVDSNKLYVAEVPAVPDGQSYHYNYVRFTGTAGASAKDSGWKRIEDATTTVLKYDNGGFQNDLGFAEKGYDNGVAHIYFDDTNTQWNTNGTNGDSDNIYFIIGRKNLAGYTHTTCVYVYQMNVVPNTNNKLFYQNIGNDWDGYTYFGFIKTNAALVSGTDYGDDINPDTLLANSKVTAYTTFMHFYEMIANHDAWKSFIGFGIAEGVDRAHSNKPVFSLDYLWIRDWEINGDGLYNTDETDVNYNGGNEGKYLNRAVNVNVTGASAEHSVSVSGYKAYKNGANNTSPYTMGINTNSATVVNDTPQNVYFVRGSTATITGIAAPAGYTLSSVTVQTWDRTTVPSTYTAATGTLTFIVPGGDDRAGTADDNACNYSPIEVVISYASNTHTVTTITNLYDDLGTATPGSYLVGNVGGGTLSVTNTTTSTSVTNGATVRYGDVLTLTAAASSNYSVEGIYYSTDGGSTWTKITEDLDITNGTGSSETRVTVIATDFTVEDYNYCFKAEYIAYHVLTVDGDESFDSMFYSMNNMQKTAYGFKVGTLITLSFENIPKNTGITAMTASQVIDPYNIIGHKITFSMPNSDVTVSALTTSTYDAKVTVKNSDKLDIAGLSATSGYFVGANVGTITIKGSSEYASATQLNGMKATIGGITVTLNADNLSDSITVGGHTISFTYNASTHTVTILGEIGGDLTLDPTLATKYNVKIFDTVMSDTFGQTKRINDEIKNAGVGTDNTVGKVVVFADNAGDRVYDKNGNGDQLDPAVTVNPGEENEYINWNDEESYDQDYDFIHQYATGTHLKLEFTFSADNGEVDPAAYYQFVGWYTGTSSGPTTAIPGGTATSIEYTVTESCFIYAVVTRDLFIGGTEGLTGRKQNNGSGDGNHDNNHNQMSFDVKRGLYYFETQLTADDIEGMQYTDEYDVVHDYNYYFRLYDAKDSTNTTIYQAAQINTGNQYSSTGNASFGVTLNSQGALNINSSSYIHFDKEDHYEKGYRVRPASESDPDYKLTIYYDPTARLIYAVASQEYKSIYLSEGNCADLNNLFDADASPAMTVAFNGLKPDDFVTDLSCNVVETSTAAGAEAYTKIDMTADSSSFTVSATITYNSTNAYYTIPAFVVYDLDDKNARAYKVAATTDGGVVFTSDTITASSNLLIVPVVELTEDGITAAGVKEYTVKVDASNVKAEDWGGMFAMYIAGTERTNADWPGQAMIPDGNVYSAKVYTKNDNSITLNSILFNNYRGNGIILDEFARLYNYPTASQTYDYYEPIALIKSGEDNTLTFRLTASNDGYHGKYFGSNSETHDVYYLYPNGTQTPADGDPSPVTVKGTVYRYYYKAGDPSKYEELTDSYKFGYLHDAGDNRMSLNGEAVPSAEVGYYVVCVGDYNYNSSAGYAVDNTYSVNSYTYDGQYAVEWFIYDASFRYLGHYLSAGLYDKNGSSANSYIVDSIYNDSELRAAFAANDESAEFPSMDYLTSKSVMIAYEAANTRGNTTRYSGQWVKTSNNKDITATVNIGVKVGDRIFTDAVNSHAAISAASYVGATSGAITNSSASVKIKSGIIWLDAGDPVGDVTFDGWYIKAADGSWIRKTTSPDAVSFKIDKDETVYAVYQVPGYYHFTYPDRVGSEKTFTVTRYLNMDEINGYTGNGNHPLVPTYDWTTEAKEYYPTANPLVDITTAAENLVSLITAYRITLTWNVTGAAVSTIGATANSTTKSVTICPAQTTATYTVNYKFANNDMVENAATSVPYGTVITFNPNHASDEGFTFINHTFDCDSITYWSASATNGEKILTTQKYFNMILSGSFAVGDVVTLYAHTDEPDVVAGTWYPILEDATNSRRITETNADKLVIDYMANYFNYEGGNVQDMINGGATVHYGIVVIKTTNDDKVDTNGKVQTLVNNFLTSGQSAAWVGGGANDAVAYRFDYTDTKHISNFNRTLYTVTSNYSSAQGKKFVAMAYIKIGDGEYFLSPLNTGLNIDVPAAG